MILRIEMMIMIIAGGSYMQGVHPWRLVPTLPARQEHRPHHIQVHHHHDGFQYQDDDGYNFEDDDG